MRNAICVRTQTSKVPTQDILQVSSLFCAFVLIHESEAPRPTKFHDVINERYIYYMESTSNKIPSVVRRNILLLE